MSEPLTLHGKLIDIQKRLKAPKSETNEFGGFKYRNLEAIEKAVKPLLHEHGLTLRFNDTIIAVGDRIYVTATAILSDGKDTIETSASAREALAKKGMDESQITGSATSYARKYAAGGLFLIDNGTDADSRDNSKEKGLPGQRSSSRIAFASEKQIKWLRDTAHKVNDQLSGDNEEVDAWIESVLTLRPERIPVYKVADAVKKLLEPDESTPQDIVVTDLPDKITLDDLPY